MSSNNEVDKLLSRYIDLAITHGKATESGESSIANKCHDGLADVYLHMERLGDVGVNAIVGMLNHDDPAVRAWASYHLLRTHRVLAEQTLEEVGKKKTLVGFGAQVTLDEWRKGTLRFPPFEPR